MANYYIVDAKSSGVGDGYGRGRSGVGELTPSDFAGCGEGKGTFCWYRFFFDSTNGNGRGGENTLTCCMNYRKEQGLVDIYD